MTDQLTTARPPARNAPSPARHRRMRTAVTIAGVAGLVATGGYVATTTVRHDAAPPTADTGTNINPSAQTLRELRQSIAGQYGSRSAPSATESPSVQTLRELRESIAGQYGSRPAASAVSNPSAHALRELHRSIAGQYGPTR